MEARRALIEAVGDRYRKSERAEKKKILDEFVELAGYYRKHAIRVLRSERRIKHAAPGMGNGLYDDAVIVASLLDDKLITARPRRRLKFSIRRILEIFD